MTNAVRGIKRSTLFCFFFLYFLVGLAFLFLLPSGLTAEMTTNYLFVLFSYFVIAGMWIWYISKYGIYIFEPATIVLTLTIMTFSIEPMISIITDDLDVNGFYVYGGCKKATIIYMVAVSAFMLCYYKNVVFKKERSLDAWNAISPNNPEQNACLDVNNRSVVVLLAYVFVIIGVAVSLVDLVLQGYSVRYILSLGTSGTLDTDESSLGVFINLRYFMLPGFLYLYRYAHNKVPGILLTMVAVMCLFARNKRWIIVLIVMAPIVLYYVEKRKKPRAGRVVAFAAIMCVIVGAMQYMRYFASTSITTVSWEGFGLQEIWKGFSGNFDLYKTLYAAVVYFPEKHFYTLGQQMIFLTIVTAIPRAIWPGKPVSIFETLKASWLGQGAIDGAWAYAQLTEYYVEFGIIGTVILMSLFGKLCRWLKSLYVRRKDIHDLVFYAIWFPYLMQVVIRGYTPLIFWPMFFMTVPIVAIKYFDTYTIWKVNKKYE